MITFEMEINRGSFLLDVAVGTDARIAGLYGPSGSGKTTLLLALAGLHRPERGRIVVDGETLFDAGRGVHVPPHARGIGVVFQDARLFPHLTVRENLQFGRSRPGATGAGLDEIVDLFELEPLLERTPGEISGGQTRLVAVGRALLARPRLLLLDEPLTGLDPARRDRMLAFLLRLKDTLPVRVLYVSHAWSDFLALVDDAVVLDQGRVRIQGHPRELTGTVVDGTGEDRLETTWRGWVVAAEPDGARVDCGGIPVTARLPGAELGQRAVVSIPAGDVLISLDPAPRTSARNRWTGRIHELYPASNRVLVEIEVAPDQRLWAEITPTSAVELGLEPGTDVELLVKASALRATGILPPSKTPASPGRFG